MRQLPLSPLLVAVFLLVVGVVLVIPWICFRASEEKSAVAELAMQSRGPSPDDQEGSRLANEREAIIGDSLRATSVTILSKASGHPVAGARVRIRSTEASGATEVVEFRTNFEGFFTASLAQARSHIAECRGRTEEIRFADHGAPTHCVIRVGNVARFDVICVGEMSEAIPDAEVYGVCGEQRISLGKSDEAGRLIVSDVIDSTWILATTESGLRSQLHSIEHLVREQVPSGRGPKLVVRLLPSRASLAGVVLDQKDRPVPAALVRIRNSAHVPGDRRPACAVRSKEYVDAVSDVNGKFELKHINRFSSRLLCKKRGFATAVVSLDPILGNVRDLVIRMSRGVTIRGTVEPSFGNSACVVLAGSGSWGSHVETKTDAHGRFVIENCRPLRVTYRRTSGLADGSRTNVMIKGRSYVFIEARQESGVVAGSCVDVTDRSDVTVSLFMRRSRAAVVRVIDAAGRGIRGIRVQASRACVSSVTGQSETLGLSANTDSDGLASFLLVPPRGTFGALDLALYARGKESGEEMLIDRRTIRLKVGRTDVRIDTPELSGGLSLRLLYRGRPACGALVGYRRADRFGWSYQRVIARDGTVRIRNLPAGDYDLQVLPVNGPYVCALARSSVAPGRTTELSDVSIAECGWIQVTHKRLTDTVSSVVVIKQGGRGLLSVGVFGRTTERVPLAPGNYEIQLTSIGGELLTGRVTVKSGGFETVCLQ